MTFWGTKMSIWEKLAGHQVVSSQASEMRACHCVGPQNGDPVCPCRMPYLKIVNGRYIETIDHGPAPINRAPT